MWGTRVAALDKNKVDTKQIKITKFHKNFSINSQHTALEIM